MLIIAVSFEVLVVGWVGRGRVGGMGWKGIGGGGGVA